MCLHVSPPLADSISPSTHLSPDHLYNNYMYITISGSKYAVSIHIILLHNNYAPTEYEINQCTVHPIQYNLQYIHQMHIEQYTVNTYVGTVGIALLAETAPYALKF